MALEIPIMKVDDTPVAAPVAAPQGAHPSYKVGVRRRTRQVSIGGIKVGGGAPISVQTMTKSKTSDIAATVAQIVASAEAGCDIVRVTVNDREAADAMAEIVRQSPIPVVADIHFNHIFALKALEAGVAKVRLNPGNIGAKDRIHQVLSLARDRGVPIRIGVNSGSLEEDILQKHGYPTAEALYESAMRHVGICDEFGFRDIIISVKSTDVRLMIEAYRLVAERTDIPLHLGVTEAGPTRTGTVKSAVGIGALLAEGIGDTIRVSLTPAPGGEREEEVRVAQQVLQSLGLRSFLPQVSACPGGRGLRVSEPVRAAGDEKSGRGPQSFMAGASCHGVGRGSHPLPLERYDRDHGSARQQNHRHTVEPDSPPLGHSREQPSEPQGRRRQLCALHFPRRFETGRSGRRDSQREDTSGSHGGADSRTHGCEARRGAVSSTTSLAGMCRAA